MTTSSGSTGATGSQDISDADLANLSDLLRWPRGCQRGLKQKRSFLLQGISEGLFSTTWPYLPGGLRAYNFCAASRCQINEEVFKRYQEEHRTETAASSSTTVPSETTVSRRGRLVWELPSRVKAYVWDNDQWRQEAFLVLENVRSDKTKLAFIDYHQVLDRASSGNVEHLGHIPRESVQQIQAFTDESGNFDVDLYIFILSYTRDRTQNILNAIGENQQLRGLLSSVIICDTPTGRYGKSAFISQVKDAFELEGKSIFVCDDSADVVEEVAYWIP